MRLEHFLLAASLSCSMAALAAEEAEAPQNHEHLVQKVQETLNARGFDAGPANGLNIGQTQAAVARFQRSVDLPASGQLDARTLLELGIEFDEPASAGSSASLEAPRN